MKNTYQVKRYKSFPKQRGSDKVVKEFRSFKEAIEFSIAINNASSSRYYVYRVGA